VAWRWIFYAVGGFVVAQIVGSALGLVAGLLAGKTSAQLTAIATSVQPPEWYVVSSLAGIWVGYVGAPWLASRRAGTRHFFSDLGLRFRPIDVLGVVIGVLAQLAIGLLYAPFQHDIHDYNAPTTRLTGASHGGGGVAVIVLCTVVLAPFAEELFFRGLLLKALVRLGTPLRSGSGLLRSAGVIGAVVLDGLLFGLAHAEWVQLAGLALLGVLLATMSYRTGRLGMNMVTHASFNLVAVLAVYKVV
jgi:membrane protease YdiL (CAAX protease family)